MVTPIGWLTGSLEVVINELDWMVVEGFSLSSHVPITTSMSSKETVNGKIDSDWLLLQVSR